MNILKTKYKNTLKDVKEDIRPYLSKLTTKIKKHLMVHEHSHPVATSGQNYEKG